MALKLSLECNECEPLAHGDEVLGKICGMIAADEGQGHTLVHFSGQLEPCLVTRKHPTHPKHPPTAAATRARQPLHAPPIPDKALKLSRKVDECKTLTRGGTRSRTRASSTRCSSATLTARCWQGLTLVHFSAQLEPCLSQ